MISIHLHDEEVAKFPELGAIGNHQSLAVAVIDNLIRAGRMLAQHLRFGGVQRQFGERALVGACEIRQLVVRLHHFGFSQETAFNNLIVLQFLFRAEHIVASVQLVG